MSLANGATFADYTVIRSLRSGEVSADYLVDGPGLARPAVLRVLNSPPRDLDRFEREIGLAKALRHPTIVEVYDGGTLDGQSWVLVENAPGPDADRLLRDDFPSGMPASGAAVILADVADALDHARERGLTHGHVTPAAILVGEPFSRVSGFGLGGVDPSGDSDQAGLAATTVQLLTGASQFEPNLLPLAKTHPHLAMYDPALTKAASADGYATCRDFVAALEAAPRAAAPTGKPVTGTGLSRRATLAATVAAVVAIAAVVVAGVYVIRHRGVPDVVTQANEPTTTVPLAPPAPPACGDGDALLGQMTERDKLAQLLMVGVTGADDARAVVANEHVGGIMIGSWTDLTMLGDPLKQIAALGSPLPLAVSTDEEGGRVSRLKTKIGVQPSARELVATGQTPDDVYRIALERGRAMRELGITVDFAPVADVSDQDDDTVIGDRSFSNDPQKVTDYAGAYARGLRDAGVTPVFKHFPGHGHASGDSHLGGVTTPPLDVLKGDDLIPYTRLLAAVPQAAVMVGHMQVPGLTGADPASLTPAAYQLLRDGTPYGGVPFGGVVFTDDISSMGAINQNYTVAQAALKALQAGADIALWITTDEVPGVLDALQKAVADGALDIRAVNQSILRIATVKGKLPACGG